MQGIIDRLQREQEQGYIRGDDGRQFAFGPGDVAGTPFQSLKLGTKVDFDVQEPLTGTDPRAVSIHPQGAMKPVASGELAPEAASQLDAEAVASQTPPEAAERNEVDEASWESFPASDPPAKHETT